MRMCEGCGRNFQETELRLLGGLYWCSACDGCIVCNEPAMGLDEGELCCNRHPHGTLDVIVGHENTMAMIPQLFSEMEREAS